MKIYHRKKRHVTMKAAFRRWKAAFADRGIRSWSEGRRTRTGGDLVAEGTSIEVTM
jgi:hypothetical protein